MRQAGAILPKRRPDPDHPALRRDEDSLETSDLHLRPLHVGAEDVERVDAMFWSFETEQEGAPLGPRD